MRVIRRVYNTFAFQSCDLEVPAVGTGSTSIYIYMIFIWINQVFQSALPGRGALYKKKTTIQQIISFMLQRNLTLRIAL